MRRALLVLSVGALVSILPACREGVAQLGAGGALSADEFTVAIATRFGPIQRGPRFNAARPRLARAALVPSSVFDAAGLWTAREGDWRQLDYIGRRDGERYRLDVQPSAPRPREAGDYRGRLRLHRLEEGRYEWVMRQELAVGSMQPDDVARTLTALFRSLEGVSAQQVRLAAEEAFPRSVAAFSRLYDLEVFELSPGAGGATAVHLEIRLRPDRMRETAPRYAAFLEKVAMPMQGSATLSDATGETWWRFEFGELHWTFRFRVRDGSLVPLDGGAERRLPDRLRLSIDFSTKAGPFTVGVRGLTAEVTLTRTPREKGYTLLYREEPEWRLPFLVKPLLRSSLRYPFEGPGSSSSFGVRASAEGPTLLARDYGFRVRESWIVKWMGGLGNSAMQDFRKGAESESDRYTRECLYALRDDLVTLLGESLPIVDLHAPVPGPPFRGGVVGERAGGPVPSRAEAPAVDALAHEEVDHGLGPGLGEGVVDDVAAAAVGVAGDLEPPLRQAGGEPSEDFDSGVAETGAVRDEHHVGVDRPGAVVFGGGRHRRCGRGWRRGGRCRRLGSGGDGCRGRGLRRDSTARGRAAWPPSREPHQGQHRGQSQRDDQLPPVEGSPLIRRSSADQLHGRPLTPGRRSAGPGAP